MFQRKLFKLTLSLILAVVMGVPVYGDASDTPRHKVVAGVAVYLGIVPSEMIQGHPPTHPESMMHGGIPTDRRDHIMIALFDEASGKRIIRATVKARISTLQGEGSWRTLESMTIADQISFGNYFIVPRAGIYRVEFEIRLPQRDDVIRLGFNGAIT